MKKVLVTGGAGFIGSHIVESLIKRKYRVGILDNFCTGEKSNIRSLVEDQKVEVHEVSITDYELVRKIVPSYDAVIHEAALVSVSRSVEDPLRVNDVNIGGTLNLLKAAVDGKVKRFVYASSSSVYGETPTLPKTETMATIPISPYGNTKLAAENYCRIFAKVYGLHTISLRYFNVYGPRQKPGPYSGVIPEFISQALEGKPPVIYGDGEQTRDFTYVGDIAEANVIALENGAAEPGDVFNVAMGGTITINELARVIQGLTGQGQNDDVKPIHCHPRAGDIRASYADVSKAKRILGYNPKYSVNDGLREVIKWFALRRST